MGIFQIKALLSDKSIAYYFCLQNGGKNCMIEIRMISTHNSNQGFMGEFISIRNLADLVSLGRILNDFYDENFPYRIDNLLLIIVALLVFALGLFVSEACF